MRLKPSFSIKTVVIVFLFFTSNVLMSSVSRESSLPEVPGNLTDAELDAVTREADNLVQEHQMTEAEIDHVVQEVETLLEALDRQDPRPLGAFHNTVLFEIPLADPVRREQRELLPVIQFTGHNLLQLVFMAARCGLDGLFFKYLKKYFLSGVFNNCEDKSEKILDALLCVERDEGGECLWSDNAQMVVADSFIAAFAPDDTTTKKIWLLLGLYALASEVFRATEYETMSMPWSGLIDWGTRNARRANEQRENGRIVVPGPAVVFSLINSWLLGGESVIAANLHVVRNSVLRFAGWHHEVFESCWFEYAKRSLILARFLGQTKAYFGLQSKRWVYEHKDELCAIVECLHKAQEGKDSELQQKINDRLKAFAAQAYDYPFFQWLQFKGNCQFWTTIWIELLLMMPSLIKIGYGYV